MRVLRNMIFGVVAGALFVPGFSRADIVANQVDADLSKPPFSGDIFKNAKEETLSLLAQPMAIPRPKVTMTEKVSVKAVHNGKWLAISMRWADTEMSEAGPLAKFSDACAIQFPLKSKETPPPIFMGAKDDPVHIFHWRLQYQIDKEKGIRDIKDIYPNMNIDIYPMEFPDMGSLEKVDPVKREVYSYGLAAGNPQSYVKKGVDEIIAEGFGTSSVMERVEAEADGKWANGEWNVVITRPLHSEDGSVLEVGKTTPVAFAVWQGAKDEVGSRKSLTLMWTPLVIGK